MPLRKSAAAIKRKIEEGQQEQLDRGLPADRVKNQLPGRTLPPTGNTGQGYTPDPDAITRISVRKNSTGSVYSRRRLNLIEGTGATLTVADVSGNEEIDITIAVTGASGGNVSSTGAAGSEPGSPASGDLYLPNNGFVEERYSGSAWVPWGPLFPLTDPAIAAPTTWINQGGASVVTTNGGIALIDPTVDSSVNYRIRKKAAPSTPYTITAAFLAPRISIDFTSCGIGWRQSSDGKLVLARTIYIASLGGWVINVLKASDPTTDVASYVSALFAPPALVWLRIVDNGTNRIVSYSVDGVNFVTIHTVGRTDYLTADEVLFCVCTRNASYPMAMTLLSWKET